MKRRTGVKSKELKKKKRTGYNVKSKLKEQENRVESGEWRVDSGVQRANVEEKEKVKVKRHVNFHPFLSFPFLPLVENLKMQPNMEKHIKTKPCPMEKDILLVFTVWVDYFCNIFSLLQKIRYSIVNSHQVFLSQSRRSVSWARTTRIDVIFWRDSERRPSPCLTQFRKQTSWPGTLDI